MTGRKKQETRSVAANLALLGRESGGAALVEFALVVPFLLLLFIASYQLLDAVAANRKVTTTVRTLTDLTAQSSSLTDAQADTILAASRQVMTPYSITPANLRISEIQISNTGVPSIVWSKALNTTPYSVGATVSVPTNMRVPNSYLIFGEITYQYSPNVGASLMGPITFTDKLFMSPRNSDSVPCCTGTS